MSILKQKASERSCENLQVTYQAVDALTPYKSNARTHSKHQIRQIAESIREFGFINPVLIDDDISIIAGHGRVQAAKLLGLDRVPTIRIEGLSDDQIRAYILADNQLALKAGWDKDILAIELQYLLTVDSLDVTVTGFEVPEIDLVLEEAKADLDADDEPPEPSPDREATCQPGDLWQLGGHRILCANALHKASYRELLGTRRASMVFTDPPFNVRIDGHATGNGEIRHREFAMASGEMSEAEFVSFLSTSLECVASFSANNSVHFVCMDWRHIAELLAATRQHYDEFLNLCVWVKNNGGMGSFYRSQHELVAVFRKGTGSHRNNIQLGQFGRNRTNVWMYPGVQTFSKQSDEGNLLAMHPTVKPVTMVADAILDCTARGEVVLDPFLGSGTTLMAAERVGRICCGRKLIPYTSMSPSGAGRNIPVRLRSMHPPGNDSMKLLLRRRPSVADNKEFELGYGKPPCSGRFTKGRSGNPKGRPKGSKNLATIVLKESRQKVRVNGPRGPRMISKLEAAITQMSNKSAQGDLRASREFITLVLRSEESVANGTEVIQGSEADCETTKNLIRRLKDFQTDVQTSKKDNIE